MITGYLTAPDMRPKAFMKTSLIFGLGLLIISGNLLAKTKIPVNFIVLQESNGQGNALWAKDNVYLQKVLDKLNADYYSQASSELVLGKKQVVKDSRLHNSPMSSGSNTLIDKYKNHSWEKDGQILVVIAREEKVDVNGRAERQGLDYDPVFIMRTVRSTTGPADKAYQGSINTSASLFSHEMGHMLNFNHADRVKTAYTTENYTKDPTGIARYKAYFSKMASYAGSGGKGGGSGGGGGRGRDGGGNFDVLK